MFENDRILITGGTGSFGRTFTQMTLEKFSPKQIVVYSRDEMKQWEMGMIYQNDPRVHFIVGDVRDKMRLSQALTDINYVVHAAATKIVPTAEYNPSECIKTNINGAMNVIDACREAGVKKVVALSTDKASNPVNLYGATKLASDKLFCASNPADDAPGSRFSVVRYGNVMGSRGSVIPFFLSQKNTGVLPITDREMTRFMISLEQSVDLVWHAFENMCGGEIYVKKIPSMKVIEIANAISKSAKKQIIGIRPGEKLHEQMIGVEDAAHCFEYAKYYKILPAINGWSRDPKRIGKGTKVPETFSYTSNNNEDWMSAEELRNWIKANKFKIGHI